MFWTVIGYFCLCILVQCYIELECYLNCDVKTNYLSSTAWVNFPNVATYVFRLLQTTHSLSHPWSAVVSGFWRRYPNPHSEHVFSEDTVECGVGTARDGVGGTLRTKRVIMKVVCCSDFLGYHSYHTDLKPKLCLKILEKLLISTFTLQCKKSCENLSPMAAVMTSNAPTCNFGPTFVVFNLTTQVGIKSTSRTQQVLNISREILWWPDSHWVWNFTFNSFHLSI